jgi:hypothetical protein
MTAPIVFPNWLRLLLAALVALAGFLLGGGIDGVNIGEDERVLILGVIAVLGSVGVVPLRPDMLPELPPWARLVLTIVVLVLT